MTIEELPTWLSQAGMIARKSGEVLKRFLGKIEFVKEKEFPGDLATEADQKSEEEIVKWINELFPTHEILAEESAHKGIAGKSDYLWVCDPLDGTTNYTHMYPMFSVSIGLVYKGEPILGVVYNPLTDQLFEAAKGLGASMNGNRLRVSKIPDLSHSLLATGFAYDRNSTPDNNYTQFCKMTSLSQGVRRGGSAALDLAHVASGCLDGFWERGLKPWDMAAGIVIVQEAGGRISDYDLSSFKLNSGRILATNGLIHEAASKVICD